MSLHVRMVPLARALYPTGSLLLASAALEFVGGALPLQPHLVQWRFATEGALLTTGPSILLALALLTVAAFVAENPLVLRTVAFGALAYGFVLLPVLVLLVLDALELRSVTPLELHGRVRNQALVAGGTGALAIGAALGIALGAWRAARGEDGVVKRAVREREARREPPPLIGDPRRGWGDARDR